MLHNDAIEMMMNNIVHAELYKEARCVRILLFCIVHGGSGSKHCLWIWTPIASSTLSTRLDIQLSM